MGYNDMQNEGAWVWSDGTNPDYNHRDPLWDSDENNRYNCAKMRGADTFWVQWNCISVLQFVCEVQACEWFFELHPAL